jgi:hypothetical protein
VAGLVLGLTGRAPIGAPLDHETLLRLEPSRLSQSPRPVKSALCAKIRHVSASLALAAGFEFN